MRIQDFARFRDVSLIQPQRTALIIPAFVLPLPVWSGASTLLAEYKLDNDVYFSFKLPVKKFGKNFIAAIRYYDTDNDVVFRYKLWDDDYAILYYPIYDGERMGLNTVLEIWSLHTTSAPTLVANKSLELSNLNFPPNQNCSACCQLPSASITITPSTPSVLPPYAYCNPFCEGLCIP